MRLSLSTITLLDQTGDEMAHNLAVAWGKMAGVLWETDYVQAHYRAKLDYLVLRINGSVWIAAPYQWDITPPALTLQHPLIEDTNWYRKSR